MSKFFYTPLLTFTCLQIMLCGGLAQAQNKAVHPVVNILFTSDAHYGISRKVFRGDTGVAGYVVNAAMIKQMNTVPGLTLPADSGVGSGKPVKHIEYLIQTGDIANRMEIPNQSATTSWKQFENDYLHHLTVKSSTGQSAQVMLVPGNHDISNAIGYYKPMLPLTDAGSITGIYNMMMRPAKPLAKTDFRYPANRVNYSRNIKGIHFMFITLWPDSAQRIWMQKDLGLVSRTMPVIVFTHDQPTCEAVHFTNPTPPYRIIPGNKFENLAAEHYKESNSAEEKGATTDIEQRGWVKFLKQHPNIKAYFHGNSNWNEFYVYHGPDNDVELNTFRVDSPMKGKYSAKDEKLMSFQLISLDSASQKLTVRECLWNTEPANKEQKIAFGKTATISLR